MQCNIFYTPSHYPPSSSITIFLYHLPPSPSPILYHPPSLSLHHPLQSLFLHHPHPFSTTVTLPPFPPLSLCHPALSLSPSPFLYHHHRLHPPFSPSLSITLALSHTRSSKGCQPQTEHHRVHNLHSSIMLSVNGARKRTTRQMADIIINMNSIFIRKVIKYIYFCLI